MFEPKTLAISHFRSIALFHWLVSACWVGAW
nr:MAG TPA: hypothetical protein [Caudoviricetes sp.]